MGSVGYRGTCVPTLFVSNVKEELYNIEGGSYSDPLDLKNTFHSFESAMGEDATKAMVFKLDLINPETHIEDQLFSMYAAYTRRSVGSESLEYDDFQRAQGVKDRVYYLRWGYMSSDDQGTTEGPLPQVALSHIHKCVLSKLDYSYSAKKERVVSLQLQDTYSNHIGSDSYLASPRTFTVGLDDQSSWLAASDVVQELLLQMTTGVEGYKGYSRISDDQKELINSYYDSAISFGPARELTYTAPVTVDPGTPTWDRTDPDATGAAPYMHALSIKRFWEDVGVSFGWDRPVTAGVPGGPAGPPTPPGVAVTPVSPVPSLNPEDGRDGGTVHDPVIVPATVDAIVGAEDTPSNPPKRYPPPPGQIDVARGEYGVGVVIDPDEAWLMTEDGRVDLTLDDLYMFQSDELFCIGYRNLSVPYADSLDQVAILIDPNLEAYADGSKFYPAYGHMSLNQFNNPDLPDESFFLGFDAPLADGVSDEYNYIRQLYKTEKSLLEATADAVIPEEASSGETPDSVDVIEESTPAPDETPIILYGPPAPPAAPPPDSAVIPYTHWLRLLVEPGQLVNNFNTLLRVLNQKFFKEAGEYLAVQMLEYANVPPEFRDAVSDVLGMDISEDEWETSEGLILFGTQQFVKDVFLAFNSNAISSFPSVEIQGEDVDKTVSLSVGYASRPDGIVTDMRWNEDVTRMMFNPRVTPVLAQTLMNIARRWEDPDTYNKVINALMFIMNSTATDPDAPPTYLEVDDFDYGTTLSELQIGDVMFSETALRRAIHQAKRIVGADPSLETGDIVGELDKELLFVLNRGMMDAFFPKIDPNDSSLVHSSYYVADTGRDVTIGIPHYRIVARSPITALQISPATDPSHEADNEMYANKLMWLNGLTKGIINVSVTTLGIPEMDILADEIMVRNVVLDVHEPRDPGTQHWLSGIYCIRGMVHSLSTKGYFTKFNLVRSSQDSLDNWSKFTLLRSTE